jgi:hypothetical protein
MKKYLLIAALLFSITASAQVARVRQLTADTITSDKTYWIETSNNYSWRLYVEWSGNDGTLTTMIPVTKTSSTGSSSNYPGISAYTITGATGYQSFSDPDGQTDSYLGLYVDVQSGKTVILKIWYYLIPKQ